MSSYSSLGSRILSPEENSIAMTRTCGRIKYDTTLTPQRHHSLRISSHRPTQRIELLGHIQTPLDLFPRAGESFQRKFKTKKLQNGVETHSRSSWTGFLPTDRSYPRWLSFA